MRPEDLVAYVISKRGEASRVAIQKIAYLADSDFVRRRMIARLILLAAKLDLRVRNETGLKYYLAKLGPFSPSLQNAVKRLLKAGYIGEKFKDGRFVYVPVKKYNAKVKGHIAEALERYVLKPEDRLVNEALKRARFDPSIERIVSL